MRTKIYDGCTMYLNVFFYAKSCFWYYISGPIREPSQIKFAVRGGKMVSKMLTYIYIWSVGPFENVNVNKKFFDFFLLLSI